MKALFIGRFQPFHRGHLEVIKNYSKKYDEIIIGIGSSQYSDSEENPFTNDERKLMINKTLEKQKISNYKIVSIPDIHNPPKWVEHVESIISDFDVVLTNNDFTEQLFIDKGYKVEKPPEYNREIYSGRQIRKKMRNNEKWEDLVPSIVAEIIKKKDGKIK